MRASANNEDNGNCGFLETLVIPRAMLDNRGESVLFRDTGVDRILAHGVPRHVQLLLCIYHPRGWHFPNCHQSLETVAFLAC